MHGEIVNGWLIKKGKQVVKFWAHGGYAIPFTTLGQVKGAVLHTQYDGVIYAKSATFFMHGIPNDYKGERQIVLPLEYWSKKDAEKIGAAPSEHTAGTTEPTGKTAKDHA